MADMYHRKPRHGELNPLDALVTQPPRDGGPEGGGFHTQPPPMDGGLIDMAGGFRTMPPRDGGPVGGPADMAGGFRTMPPRDGGPVGGPADMAGGFRTMPPPRDGGPIEALGGFQLQPPVRDGGPTQGFPGYRTQPPSAGGSGSVSMALEALSGDMGRGTETSTPGHRAIPAQSRAMTKVTAKRPGGRFY